MEILLIRHAIAVERTTTLEDAMRPLAPRGVERFQRAVRGLERLEIRLAQVFHSPWLRAAQTAELLAPVTVGEHQATELLADDPGDELLDLARRCGEDAHVAFVGHEPWMGELLSLLLTGTTRFGDSLPFKKGGVAWVHGAPRPGKAALRAMLTPRALRQLGGGD